MLNKLVAPPIKQVLNKLTLQSTVNHRCYAVQLFENLEYKNKKKTEIVRSRSCLVPLKIFRKMETIYLLMLLTYLLLKEYNKG